MTSSAALRPWMISRKENAALAQHQIEPGRFVVHQDQGAPMIAHSYRDFLDALGVRRSYSRPRVSNDNPFSPPRAVPEWAAARRSAVAAAGECAVG